MFLTMIDKIQDVFFDQCKLCDLGVGVGTPFFLLVNERERVNNTYKYL